MYRYPLPARAALLTTVLLGSLVVWACRESPAAIEFDDPGFRRAASITLFPNNMVFDEPGESFQFTARVNDQAGYSVVGARVHWESSDRSVVSVDSLGLVTAVSPGSGTITAIHDNVTAKADVVVR